MGTIVRLFVGIRMAPSSIKRGIKPHQISDPSSYSFIYKRKISSIKRNTSFNVRKFQYYKA